MHSSLPNEYSIRLGGQTQEDARRPAGSTPGKHERRTWCVVCLVAVGCLSLLSPALSRPLCRHRPIRPASLACSRDGVASPSREQTMRMREMARIRLKLTSPCSQWSAWVNHLAPCCGRAACCSWRTSSCDRPRDRATHQRRYRRTRSTGAISV